MASFRARTRFASLVAIGLVLLLSGVVAGAAGGNFILGMTNSAGTANTSLATSSTGNALLVTQNGTGTAIRGSTGSGAGIAGFFTSGSGSGVSGVVASRNSYGIYAANDSASSGTGAALRVQGNVNRGLIATSSESTAIVGSSSCSDLLCGATGIDGTGGGLFGSGVVGHGAIFGAGVHGTGGLEGVFGTNTLDGGTGVYGLGTNGPGVTGSAPGAGTIDYDCGTGGCRDFPGGSFAGYIGVIGQTDGLGPQGYSRGVMGIANASGTWGVYSAGDATVEGNLFVTGACFGCVAAAIAQNGSNQTIAQGDAVTLLGVTTGADGSVVMLVGPAKSGDAIFGIADLAMSLSPAKVTTKASSIEVQGIEKEKVTVISPSFTVDSKDRKWVAGATSAKADAYLRVITYGMLVYESDGAGLTAGDVLAVGTNAGKLSKADAQAGQGAVAGKFGGRLKDGRIVVFVNPS